MSVGKRKISAGASSLVLALVLGAVFSSLATSSQAEERNQNQDAEMTRNGEQTESGEHLLFIQGRLRPGGEADYQKYLAGTQPLMAKYGAAVLAVGSGVGSANTSDAWPINAVLSFPSREQAEGFLADPAYLEIKERYRERAYEELHLTLVAGRKPKVRTAREVAEEAFADFRAGLAGGSWQPFLDRLSKDFTLRFPAGKYQGVHHGRKKAAEFFAYVSSVFPSGIEITEVEGVTAEGQRVVFEFTDEGELRGAPYRNHVAISLDVCGEEICGYREYFGLVGPPPAAEDGE